MDGEPIEDERDDQIPVNGTQTQMDAAESDEADGSVPEGLPGSAYSEPREGPGPDVRDAEQDEYPSPETESA